MRVKQYGWVVEDMTAKISKPYSLKAIAFIVEQKYKCYVVHHGRDVAKIIIDHNYQFVLCKLPSNEILFRGEPNAFSLQRIKDLLDEDT